MTRLLVSVRNADEAREALRGSADWIDLKDPAKGALGAVSSLAAEKVVSVVRGRTPVSAACGELSECRDLGAVPPCVVQGISFAKVGLAGCCGTPWQSAWQALRKQLADVGCQLVAVAYVDAAAASAPPPQEVIALAADHGGYVLFDTYDKSGGSLLAHWGLNELSAVLHSVRAAGLKSVVAGRLDTSEIARLPLELIDMIGVRGAACDRGRDGTVSAVRVRELRSLLTLPKNERNERKVLPSGQEFA
jgi:uncharacterized protein (UPF0264 family)